MFDGLASELEWDAKRLAYALDGHTPGHTQQLFAAIIADTAAGDIVLDCSGIGRIDATGIAAIAYLFKRLTAQRRNLRLVGLSDATLETLRDYGLARVLLSAPEAARAKPRKRRGFSAMLAFSR